MGQRGGHVTDLLIYTVWGVAGVVAGVVAGDITGGVVQAGVGETVEEDEHQTQYTGGRNDNTPG